MANVKISDLPAASGLSTTDVVPITQSGTTSRTTAGAFTDTMTGFIATGSGTVARIAQDKMRERLSVFDFMTTAEIADVQANTAAVDVTTAFAAAITAAKALYDGTNFSGPELVAPAGTYLCTSPLFFGASTSAGGKIVRYRGTGAVILGKHTGIVVDCTGMRDANIQDLHVVGSSVTKPTIGVALVRLAAGDGANGNRNNFINLRVAGTFTQVGVVWWGSESNDFTHLQIDADEAVASAVITDTGEYWDGAAFQSMTFPNTKSGDPPVAGESTTNNHFFGPRISQRDTSTTNGRAALQIIGGGKHTFYGSFFNINDTVNLKGVQLLKGTGGGNPDKMHFFGFNPHTPNDIAFDVVNGTANGLTIIGDSLTSTGSDTSDVHVASGANIWDSNIECEKIDIEGGAQGYNRFRVGTSFEADGTVTGELILGSGSPTVTLGGNLAAKRLRIFDTGTGRTYSGRDVKDFVGVSTSGTGEDNLKTLSITGSATLMGVSDSVMKIRATGTKTGSAGNKTIKYHLATGVAWTVFPAANDTLDWAMEVEVYATGTATQILFIKGYQNNTLVYAQTVTATVTMTSNATTKITGECADGADAVTITSWIVEFN